MAGGGSRAQYFSKEMVVFLKVNILYVNWQLRERLRGRDWPWSFIHKCFLSTYSLPGNMLGLEDIAMNEIGKVFFFLETYIWTDFKQMNL